MKFLSKDELTGLLKAAKETSERDYLMVLMMFVHGLRVTEVVGGWLVDDTGAKYWYPGLTVKSLVDGYVTVPRLKGSLKTTQRLTASELAALETFAVHSPDGRLFPIHRQTAWRRVKMLGVKAGIPAFKCYPHALKHTCAMTGLKGGMSLPELQTRLGHKSGSSTMAYLRVDDDAADKAFEAAAGGF